MNILAICHFELYRDLSSSFVHNQIREYTALGHRVVCIVPIPMGKADRKDRRLGPAGEIINVDGVDILDVRYLSVSGRGRKSFNHKSAIAAIRRQLGHVPADFIPDVIHAHTLGFDSRIGAWLKEIYHCPLIVTTHGGDTARPLARGEGDILRRDCEACDQIVSVSGPLKAQLETCGTVTPIEVIHNGFIPRDILPAERDPFGIIQVGHLVESKRFDATIRALALLKDTYPQLHLTIVGQGHLREKLEDLSTELGVADRVAFTGAIPNGEVFARMCENTFFVMASKPEGFGIVYLEAMAAGCVAVGTRDQGIADIIRNGENGFLVEAGDETAIAEILRRLLDDPEHRDIIAKAGQAEARTMTWTESARRYLQLFESLKGR